MSLLQRDGPQAPEQLLTHVGGSIMMWGRFATRGFNTRDEMDIIKSIN